jgi:hypothetical protein
MSEPTRPTPPPFPTADQIPSELLHQPRFTAWQPVLDEEKWRKPPHSPVTSERVGPVEKNAEHFLPFEEALAGAKRHNLDGIGLVFFKADCLVFIDIDDAINEEGVTDPEVKTWLQWFSPTWVHESPSGTGYHIIGRGKISKALPATPLSKTSTATVEMYAWDRYATLTGKLLPGGAGAVLGDIQVGIDKLLAHLEVKETSAPNSAPENAKPVTSAWVRQLYQDKLTELRNVPVNSGNGNATLNNVTLVAARVCLSRVFDKTEEQFKNELFDTVTKGWAKPHDENGARATIASGWAKGISEGPYKLIEIVKVEELQRPDMPASVLCGKLGEICRARLSDFPIAYSWLSVLASASVLVKPHHAHRCNIYVATVGSPDSGKSESQRRANFLFALDKQDGLMLDEKFGSAEGMMEKIGDRKGETVIWSPDELSHLLEKAQIQGASFPFILNTLFYNDRNNLTVQRRKHIPFNARVTIAGGVVEENFGNSFGAATAAGLYSRFLFGLCPSNFRYLYRPLEGSPVVEEKRVSAQLPFGGEQDVARQLPRLEAPTVRPDVWTARDQIHEQEKIEPRLLELCIRTALICAAWDGKSELRASDLEPAWELARYQQRVRVVLQPNPGRNFEAMAAHKIMDYMKSHTDGEKWLEWRTIYRATHVLDFGPSVADRAMSELVFIGEIERVDLAPAKGGKKKTLVRLARE